MSSAAITSTIRDDRVLPLTRGVAIVVVVAVFIGFALLYPFPAETDRLWAWTIKPTMTPMLMGAGYMAGVYYFWRVYRATAWHTVGLGFLPVTAFAWSMLVATILHWDRFNGGHVVFMAWTALYAITPLLVPAVWWANHKTDPGPVPGELMVPRAVRVACALLGVVVLVLIACVFIRPAWAIDLSPWKLTPFTARVVAGWFSLTGVIGLAIAADGRWSAARVPLQSALVGIALILLGAARAWSEFDLANPASVVFVGSLIAMLIACAALIVVMDRRLPDAAAG